MSRPLLSVEEMRRQLDMRGYRVIPKGDIVRIGAEVAVATEYESEPGFEEYAIGSLTSSIARELRPLIKLYRVDAKDWIFGATLRTTLEVIKP